MLGSIELDRGRGRGAPWARSESKPRRSAQARQSFSSLADQVDLAVEEAVIVVLARGHHVAEFAVAADLQLDPPASLVEEEPARVRPGWRRSRRARVGVGIHEHPLNRRTSHPCETFRAACAGDPRRRPGPVSAPGPSAAVRGRPQTSSVQGTSRGRESATRWYSAAAQRGDPRHERDQRRAARTAAATRQEGHGVVARGDPAVAADHVHRLQAGLAGQARVDRRDVDGRQVDRLDDAVGVGRGDQAIEARQRGQAPS